MTVRKKKYLTVILELLLYIILVSGIVFFLVVYGIAPSSITAWKMIFIISHKCLGYLFWILILWHALMNRKWYKAWFSGKIKNTRKSLVTKIISILFLLMTISFFFEDMLPRKIYALLHAIIGIGWVVFMIYHIVSKRNVTKKCIS